MMMNRFHFIIMRFAHGARAAHHKIPHEKGSQPVSQPVGGSQLRTRTISTMSTCSGEPGDLLPTLMAAAAAASKKPLFAACPIVGLLQRERARDLLSVARFVVVVVVSIH